MQVAAVQHDIRWHEPAATLREVEPLVAEAASRGARLVVLPEMFATGFSMEVDRVVAMADEIRAGAVAMARAHGVYLAAGWAEAGARRPRNVCRILAPDGSELGCYAKVHPFSMAGESRHYEAGEELVTVELEGVRVTPLICYDLRFPELFRAAASATDLFVVPANWPAPRIHAWSTLLAARAMDAQAWVLGVNRVGADASGMAHPGGSALVAPDGRPLAVADDGTAVLVGEIRVDDVRAARDRYPFLADRRADVYRRLARE